MSRLKIALRIAMLVQVAPGALAQTADVYRAISPQQMSTILMHAGCPAEIADKPGDGGLLSKIVKTTIDGKGVFIYFWDCKGESCDSAQIVLGLAPEPRFTESFANRWNQKARFSRGMLAANGNFVIQYDVEVAGGVTEAYLTNCLSLFSKILTDFDAFR
jgi:hypothetical protein